MDLVLAIDQGTTSTKALLVGPCGEIVAAGNCPVGIVNRRPGWFEQDGQAIWDSVTTAVGRCLQAGPETRPVALAISNQRESVAAWDRSTGAPLGPVLGWQDARTATRAAELAAGGAGAEVRRLTGLPLSPMFSALKIRWLLDSLGSIGLRRAVAGTLDAYLVHRLTGGQVTATDGSNASRTLLCRLDPVGWDSDLLRLFGVPEDVLPSIRPSNGDFGVTRPSGPLPGGIPIRAVLGDSHAALFGHGIEPGEAKVTYGTGSSVMKLTAAPESGPASVSTTVAWLLDRPVYAREGNILATGAAVDTVARLLGMADAAALAALARNVDQSPLTLVPAFSGLGSPHWDPRAVGLIAGLGRDARPEQLAYAAIDAVAQQVCDVLDAMESGGEEIGALLADGGATVNAQLMQLQADLAGRPVAAAATPELSALGAAAMAWRGLGAPPRPRPQGTVYQPQEDAAWRDARRSQWTQALSRSRGMNRKDGAER
ncbi:MAG: hypothetical protein LBD97_10125 [Bifidobacteriaceae bacterium]|jgi:glycerol kinase|nr:hypothetical protein [Bifidobacteriaceae bacterium]